MTRTTALRAAKKLGPGYFIREQMDYRDWTQDDLASIMGLSLKHVNKILQDKQPLTLDVARLLGEIFNTSAQYWINLDTSYRLWLQSEPTSAEKDADIRSLIYERMPVKDMLAKGWLKPFSSVSDLKKQVLTFWNWATLDFSRLDQELIAFLTRKSDAFNQYNASYALTWYQKARNEAVRFNVPPYNKEKLTLLYNRLHTYTVLDMGITRFIEELNACGVIFFVLPHLQKTYLDGAAFLMDQTPVIVYTGRYKRIDHFWFTLAHEIAHILLHLGPETPFLLDDLKNGEINALEEEANAMAARILLHDEILAALDQHLHYLTTDHIELCAAELNIHPAIIAGKLAFEKKTSYKIQGMFQGDVFKYLPTFSVLQSNLIP